MLLVILGAGASYDSVEVFDASVDTYRGMPERPPLANHLFDHRFVDAMEGLAGCAAIAGRLRPGPDENIEKAFAELAEIASYNDRRRRQLLETRIYLQQLLWRCEQNWVRVSGGKSNYATLLDDLDDGVPPDEPICLVTFNYDTLLDRALFESDRLRPGHVDYFVEGPRWRLFRPHGSLSWGRRVEVPSSLVADFYSLERVDCAKRIAALPASNLVIKDHYDWVGTGNPLTPYIGANPHEAIVLIPAIAIPVAKKDAFECPASHVSMLDELIPKTTRILIVGWKAGDQHLVDMLKRGIRSGTPLYVIDRDATCAKQVAESLETAEVPVFCSGTGKAKQGFSWATRTGVVRDFLRNTPFRA